MYQPLRGGRVFQLQPGLAQSAVDGVSETLPITLRIGLLQHIAHRVELQSTASTGCLFKQIISLIKGQWPIGHIQALQKVLMLFQHRAGQAELIEMLRSSRGVVADQLAALVVRGIVRRRIGVVMTFDARSLLEHRHRP